MPIECLVGSHYEALSMEEKYKTLHSLFTKFQNLFYVNVTGASSFSIQKTLSSIRKPEVVNHRFLYQSVCGKFG